MQPEPMNQADEQMRALDGRIVDALECAPRVRIPEGFAARVAARVPARRVSAYWLARIRATRYGVRVAIAALIVLAVAMLVLAPHTTGGGPFWKLMEWTLCAQFCVLAGWLALWRFRIE
jgi:hypothetical protein